MKNSAEKVDPRVGRTRKLLQQAMCELMREKDFTDINVQDIAERAELNRATFYKHFLDKYDLLNRIISLRLQMMLDERLPAHSTLTHANLNILIQTVFDYLISFRGSCRLSQARNQHNMMMQQVQKLIYDVLLNWMQHGQTAAPPSPVDHTPETVALMTSWMIFGPFMQVAWGTYKLPQHEVISQVEGSVAVALEQYLVEDESV